MKFVGIYMDNDGDFFAGIAIEKQLGISLYDLKGLDYLIEAYMTLGRGEDVRELKEAKEVLSSVLRNNKLD